ncbi:MAG: C39 family peptidase [Saprospiraceae bacterium]|nr:C39 family peptidase [Saprospiraceae bacterium]
MVRSIFPFQKIRVINDVPYVSQFANPDYAEKILRNRVEMTSDPNWRETGAESEQEYAKWVLNICGMACLSMALRYFKCKVEGTIILAKDAFRYQVFKEKNKGLSGMHYKEFCIWVRNYGLNAVIYTSLGIRGLQKLLSDGKLIIASVHPDIREYRTLNDSSKKGGHLVLLIGYDKQKNTLIFHNPSGFSSNNTQNNQEILVPKFLEYFAGRGIAIYPLRQNHVKAKDKASKIAIFLSSLSHNFLSLGRFGSNSGNFMSKNLEISYLVTAPRISNTSLI